MSVLAKILMARTSMTHFMDLFILILASDILKAETHAYHSSCDHISPVRKETHIYETYFLCIDWINISWADICIVTHIIMNSKHPIRSQFYMAPCKTCLSTLGASAKTKTGCTATRIIVMKSKCSFFTPVTLSPTCVCLQNETKK